MDFATGGIAAVLLFIALVLAKVVDIFILPKIKINGTSQEDRREKATDNTAKINAIEVAMAKHIGSCNKCHESIRKLEGIVCKIDDDGLPLVYFNRSSERDRTEILRNLSESITKLSQLMELNTMILRELKDDAKEDRNKK